jgi:hypothetical protein
MVEYASLTAVGLDVELTQLICTVPTLHPRFPTVSHNRYINVTTASMSRSSGSKKKVPSGKNSSTPKPLGEGGANKVVRKVFAGIGVAPGMLGLVVEA